MELLLLITLGIIVVVLVIFGLKLLLEIGKIALYILLHMIFGLILLFLFNLLPFFKIPINVLTLLIAGFGGVFGVLILIIAKALGFY